MRQSHIYLAIKECKEEYGDPIELSCDLFGVSRAAYYRWLSGKKSTRELENEKVAEIMEQIHTENPDKGYRRIKDANQELNCLEKTGKHTSCHPERTERVEGSWHLSYVPRKSKCEDPSTPPPLAATLRMTAVQNAFTVSTLDSH